MPGVTADTALRSSTSRGDLTEAAGALSARFSAGEEGQEDIAAFPWERPARRVPVADRGARALRRCFLLEAAPERPRGGPQST
jgi:hypothetical protein